MIDAVMFKNKHQLWLRLAMMSFSITNSTLKSRLYEFSQIEFRHLKWVAESLIAADIPYDYERDAQFKIEGSTFFELIGMAIDEIKKIHLTYDNTELCTRMLHDEIYLLQTLENYLEDPALDEKLSAFDRSRCWPDTLLSPEQSDALTLFLFEESYKEYELIMIYFYRQVRATTATQYGCFQDLIDESHFHLRSFGEMMAKMGILALPRVLHPRTYKIEDMEKFLLGGIDEENKAKEECVRLSSLISDEKLSTFFEFVNYQESYHIEIMKKLLKETHE